MSELVRMVVVLSLIACICSAVLTFANHRLEPQIQKQTDYYVRGPALERLFGRPAEEVLNNKVVLHVNDQDIPVFFSRANGQVSVLAVETTGQGGFGGDLKLMIGIDLNAEKQTGLEVVSHSETPGLGARIEEPGGFRLQWQGLPLEGKIALKADGGDLDAISGATTTSRAAVRGTNEAMEFLHDHKDEILKSISEIQEGS